MAPAVSTLAEAPSLAAWYDQQLATRPFTANCATSGLISVFADLLRHVLTAPKGSRHSLIGAIRQFIIGFAVMAPIATNWFQFVERLFVGWPADRLRTVLIKTAVDQSVFAPTVNVAFMTSLGVLEGRGPEEITKQIRENLLPVMKSNVCFWGPITLLMYRFVPPQRRVLTGNLANIVWMLYLISKTSKAAPKDQAVDVVLA